MTTLIISSEETNGIMKVITFLKDTGLLIEAVSETIENDAKEWKGGLLGMLLGTLGASFLRNLLTDKGVRGSKLAGHLEVLKEQLELSFNLLWQLLDWIYSKRN